MNRTSKGIVAAVFLLFAALNVVTLSTGVQGLVQLIESNNVWAYCLFADLAIAVGLVVTWMVRDAREKGRNAVPFVLLSMTLGSIGPLLYLLTGRREEPSRELRARTAA